MPLYAHALIELIDGSRFNRGDEVPEDALNDEDREALLDGGALSEDEYDPAADVSAPPATVVIDGVTYNKQEDSDA